MLYRLLWVVIQLLAAWGVIYIILDVWREYINSPTVTTVASTNHPIWEVPFPAVAVCNINKLSKSATWNLAQNLYVT
jgi:amiloride-sensitive sodium channel